MRPVTYTDGSLVDRADWLAAISGPHTMTSRANVYLAGNLVESNLSLSSGRVTSDRNAAVRSRCSATLPTKRVTTNVSAFGHEIELWRGVVRPGRRNLAAQLGYLLDEDGNFITTEGGDLILYTDAATLLGAAEADDVMWVNCGVFAIQSTDLDDDGGDAVLSVEGDDLSRKISDAKLADAVVWTSADVLETKVAELIAAAVPYLSFAPEGGTHLASDVTHERGADPWGVIVEAAKAVGFEVWCDGFVVHWRPEPDQTEADPVATIVDGQGGAWVSGSVNEDRGPAFNEWPVVGSNSASTAEFYAVAYDEDPLSAPDGVFGRKPAPVERLAQVDDQAKADAAAAGRRNKERGVPRTITVKSWPNPALEAGDAIELRRTVLGVDEVVLVDVLSMGMMSEDDMVVTARTRR